MKRAADRSIIEELQRQISGMENNRTSLRQELSLGLGPLEGAFQGKVFPRAAIHEFISFSSQQAACTSGFISVVVGKLMKNDSVCVWVSTKPRRAVFAPALKIFGVEPHRILFVDTDRPTQTLYALEEALKCSAVTAVVGELNELGFNESRRLQLAVEQSRVTGFIHRFRPKNTDAVACVSRWKITSLASTMPAGLPGVGFPRWNVQLQKVRNGMPGEWQVQWSPKKGLEYLNESIPVLHDTDLKAG
jgi:protein ImuA